MGQYYKIFAGAMVLFVLSFVGASAHKDATGIIKERMDTMTAMGKSLGVIVDMIKGKTEFDAKLATQSSSALFDHSLNISKQFPDTSESKTGKHTKSMANIWEDRAGFDKLLKALQDESEKLAQISAMNDPKLIRSQFAEVIEICSACHEKYRLPN